MSGLALFAAWLRESRRRARYASRSVVLAAVLGTGCRTEDQVLNRQKKTLSSLQATTAAVGRAWLSGTVSRNYARITLERTRQLVEQQRTELAATPQRLVDPRGALLSQEEERLSRMLALLWQSVNEGDSASVRAHLSTLDRSRSTPR
jgi:hypothetical protein